MLRSLFRLLLGCFLVSLLASSLQAQRAPGRGQGGIIDVQIRYADGRPGPRDIHVRLEAAEGGAEADLETIEGGKCRFVLASSGVFIVRIAELHYQEASARVEITGIPTAYVTLVLKPLDDFKQENVSATSVNPSETVSVADLNIPENARQEFAKGEDALQAKNPEESTRHFEKAVALYDKYPQAYRMLGEVYAEQRDFVKAEAALKKSIELEPKLAASYIDLGALRNQTRNYMGAEEALKQGLELSPDATAGKYELAKTYWSTNRWQEAAPLAEESVKRLPDLAAAHVLLANIKLKERDGKGALHEFQEYLRLEPNGAMASQVSDMVAKLQKALSQPAAQ